MPSRLIVRPLHGPPRDVPLDTSAVTIGRSSNCDLVLDFAYISRVHARVEPIESGYILVDDESTNGTFVNGARLHAPHVLAAGDHITIAEVSITFQDSTGARDVRTLPMPNDCPVRCDPATRRVWIGEETTGPRLSAQEFQLVLLLSAEYGRVCPRDELATAIWGRSNYDRNMLHRLVHRLKEKLGRFQHLVQNVPGVGYVMGISEEI